MSRPGERVGGAVPGLGSRRVWGSWVLPGRGEGGGLASGCLLSGERPALDPEELGWGSGRAGRAGAGVMWVGAV